MFANFFGGALDRRSILGLGLAAATVAVSGKDSMAAEEDLWPGVPPGSLESGLAQNVPTLQFFSAAHSNGSALIIAPGGGYLNLNTRLEGDPIAKFFAARGVSCFVLRYRLPNDSLSDRAVAPLQDAQRAMRVVRTRASKYSIDPTKVAFIGFSAGGHVAALAATKAATRTYSPIDDVDQMDARPNLCALLYPVITMGQGAHGESRTRLLGASPAAAEISAYSAEQNVTSDTPPTFICFAADDRLVSPIPNSLGMFTALRAVGIPSEMHAFEEGGHGFGLGQNRPNAAWPDLFLRWGARHGVFSS